MNEKIPEYLYEKSVIIKTIIFTSIFALIFINIYQPFNSKEWYPGISNFKYFTFSSFVILAGVLVVVISRIIMYYHCKKKPVTIGEYVLWVAMEIILMATFYTSFEVLALHDPRDFFDMTKQSIINTSLVLLLPYSTTWLYFALRNKSKKLEKFKEESILEEKSIFLFTDEKKNLKLSVKKEQVFYIESADNYVKIHYLNKGKISTFMLRNKIKNIENDFENSTLIRCHRSYIVNFENVKILRKEKNSTFLDFDNEQIPDIPVSKSYVENIIKMFYKYSV